MCARAGLVYAAGVLVAGFVVTVFSLTDEGASFFGLTERVLEPHAAQLLNWTVTAAQRSPGQGLPASTVLQARTAVALSVAGSHRSAQVNSSWPGPLVIVGFNQTLTVRLRNAQDEPLAIHWHGLHQDGTPGADGAGHASASPLVQGGSNEVSFRASPMGTHFWHAHAGLAAMQGLHGGIIVPEPLGTLPPYDAEVTLVLDDFYSQRLAHLRSGLLQRGPAGSPSAFRWVGDPDALLVNGESVIVNATAGAQGAVVTAPAGTLRIRLINACSLSALSVAAAGHMLTVIQAGGGDAVQPFNSSEVLLSAGERLSVLLTPSAAAHAAGGLWLAIAIRHRPKGPFGALALRFTEAQLPPPPQRPLPAQSGWNDTAATVAFYSRLVAPRDAPPPPPPPAGPPVILFGAQQKVQGLMRWTVNGLAFAYPGDPLIAQVVNASALLPSSGDSTAAMDESEAFVDAAAGAGRATMLGTVQAAALGDTAAAAVAATWLASSALFSPARVATSVLAVPRGSVFDIVLVNGFALNNVSEVHPWHLHGMSFWQLGLGQGAWPPSQGQPQPQPAPHPPLLDTVTLPPAGWAWLRVKADNAGMWPLHCHVVAHLFMGMQVILVVGAETLG